MRLSAEGWRINSTNVVKSTIRFQFRVHQTVLGYVKLESSFTTITNINNKEQTYYRPTHLKDSHLLRLLTSMVEGRNMNKQHW